MEYFISDLHLFHENCIRFDDRPFDTVEQMHEAIIYNWNNRITNGDTVYILGDISMKGTNLELIQLVSTLKGKKVLILGNHDRPNDYRYQKLFEEITDYKIIQTSIPNTDDPKKRDNVHVVLCHFPILMWNNQHRGYIHLYGHVHNSVEEVVFQKAVESLNDSIIAKRRPMNHTVRAYNVGCMMPWMNYTPRTLEEIITKYNPMKMDSYRKEGEY